MSSEPATPPIAVVGLGVLTPGAVGVEDFWRMVLERRDLITDVPRDRWLVEDYYDPDPSAPDHSYVRRGGFLSDVDFDPMSYGIPPSTLAATDTSQLLALVVARQVFDAIGLDGVDRERVGVILGASTLDLIPYTATRLQGPLLRRVMREHGLSPDDTERIAERVAELIPPWTESTFPGGLTNVVAGRVANRFDLHGVNHTTDAACASSFAALASAVAELRLGRSDLVLTGGVDTFNDITAFVGFSKTPALSLTGDCRPFSDRADGTMLGEALGMLALKRLEDAERDGDRVHALIRGVGASSDGRSTSIYAPLEQGQRRALRHAYAEAGYGPETVELVEAHGTATRAGDVAEFTALRAVFEETGRVDRQWCALGSVKSQIGHTKCAAGAVGLIKAVLAVQQGVLPPTIKVDRPNPELGVDDSPFHVNTRARPWVRSADHPRRAAVSSFGFGGSNFHVTVEEYRPPVGTGGRPAWRVRSCPAELVLVSAGGPSELAEAARALDTGQPLADLARRSQADFRREAPARLAVVVEAGGVDALGEAADLVERRPDSSFATPAGWHYGVGAVSPGRVGFLFPGQGSQYVGMGADLAVHLSSGREAWDEAADLDFGPELRDRVFPPPSFSEDELHERQERLTATGWAQPALAAHSAALLRVLRSVGLRPDCVAGHSFGEVTALHAAGAFDLASLLRIARRRGELMEAVPGDPGVMLAVSGPAERVAAVLGDHPGSRVWVANHNAPDQVVIAGATEAVAELATALAAEGFSSTPLRTAAAFHTPLVAAVTDPLAAFLAEMEARPPGVEVFGGADARPYPREPDEVRRRLVEQATRPVLFTQVVEEMYGAGVRTFVEVGPSAVLTGLVGRVLADRDHLAVPLDRPGRCGVRVLWDGLARLAVAGVPLDRTQLWAGYGPTRTGTEVVPRMTVRINGGNYGRPYPPPDGSGELPGPPAAHTAPPGPSNGSGVGAVPAPPAEPATPAPAAEVGAGGGFTAPPEWGPGEPPSPRPPIRSVAPAHPGPPTRGPVDSPTAPGATTPGASAPSAPGAPTPPATNGHGPVPDVLSGTLVPPTRVLGSGWLRIVEEAQRQTAQAHADFQRMLTESHLTYLRMAESTFTALLAGGEAAPGRQAGPWPPAPAEPPSTRATLPTPPSHRVPEPAVEPWTTVEAPGGGETWGPTVPTAPPPQRTGPAPAVGEPQVAWEMAPAPQAPAAAPLVPSSEPGPAPVGTELTAPAGRGADLPALDPERIEETLLSVVADRTGYPVDVLNLDMELEADLGIDSIKKVEVFSSLRELVGELAQDELAEWARLRTLREVADRLAGRSEGTSAPTSSLRVEEVPDLAPSPSPTPPDLVRRFVVEAREAVAPGEPTPRLGDAPIVVTDDGGGIAPALVERLRRQGIEATVVDDVPETASAAILLGALTEDTSPTRARAVSRAALAAARRLAPRATERGGLLVTVQDTGGDFGLDGGDPARAWLGGLAALARTAAREWPLASVRALDCARGGRGPEQIAEALVTELTVGGATPAVGLRADGSRVVPVPVPAAVVPDVDQSRVGPGSVIVVTGGARGVTAAAMRAMAEEHQPYLALIGRTELVEEPPGLDGATEEADLVRSLASSWGDRADGPPSPAELAAEARRVLAVREIRATLDDLRALGSPVRYLSVDVRDEAAVAAALDEVRRDWGPITGLVHGAGTLADRLLADKTDEQFDRVLDTKVGGLRALLTATEDDPVELLCVFSSVAGCFGNAGQADYAMANEVLDLVASSQRITRPDCLVRSLAWGPWHGGMVGPALAERFERAGVPLIPLGAGATAFTEEVTGSGAATRVVLVAPRTLAAFGVDAAPDEHAAGR
ncbi:beta keto-acyl synthase [Actinoalloteichus sp. AHMU CJ021]|uniref:type I polyketide synthase n=1 Tax=Actinoalloteichus sp. AHMU CJ021 TaxID=2072503 RepID=UPI000CA008C7|nr:beta keto-acyl synthase [Actinoalloteichus sp. AHMU CJ021]